MRFKRGSRGPWDSWGSKEVDKVQKSFIRFERGSKDVHEVQGGFMRFKRCSWGSEEVQEVHLRGSI